MGGNPGVPTIFTAGITDCKLVHLTGDLVHCTAPSGRLVTPGARAVQHSHSPCSPTSGDTGASRAFSPSERHEHQDIWVSLGKNLKLYPISRAFLRPVTRINPPPRSGAPRPHTGGRSDRVFRGASRAAAGSRYPGWSPIGNLRGIGTRPGPGSNYDLSRRGTAPGTNQTRTGVFRRTSCIPANFCPGWAPRASVSCVTRMGRLRPPRPTLGRYQPLEPRDGTRSPGGRPSRDANAGFWGWRRTLGRESSSYGI
jgi:hypothetical protein